MGACCARQSFCPNKFVIKKKQFLEDQKIPSNPEKSAQMLKNPTSVIKERNLFTYNLKWLEQDSVRQLEMHQIIS